MGMLLQQTTIHFVSLYIVLETGKWLIFSARKEFRKHCMACLDTEATVPHMHSNTHKGISAFYK